MSFTFNQRNFPKYDSWGRIGIQSRLSIWALGAQQSGNLNNDEGYSWESLIQLLNSGNEKKKKFIITSWSKILYGKPGAASEEELLDIFTEWDKQKKINDDKFSEQVRIERKKEREAKQEEILRRHRAAAPSATGPTSKGRCFFCGKNVLSNQERLKTREGHYAHKKCAMQESLGKHGSLQETVHKKYGGRRRKTKKRRRKRKTKRNKRKTKKRRRKRKRKTKKKRRR